jgi:hypothetical protein
VTSVIKILKANVANKLPRNPAHCMDAVCIQWTPLLIFLEAQFTAGNILTLAIGS